MPQILVLVVVGAGLYAGYRWLSKEARRASETVKRAQEELSRRAAGTPEEKDLGALERDPATGVYRPRKTET
ncbi:MAG: hypothetical protein KDJ41_21120 [Hyphomicrobiaceae bacterium]|nr:hypothetical protein [Hyphomicrobiaceae bacterium]